MHVIGSKRWCRPRVCRHTNPCLSIPCCKSPMHLMQSNCIHLSGVSRIESNQKFVCVILRHCMKQCVWHWTLKRGFVIIPQFSARTGRPYRGAGTSNSRITGSSMLCLWILMPATCNHAMQIKMAIDHVICRRFNAMNVVSMVILSGIAHSYGDVVRSSCRTGGVKL